MTYSVGDIIEIHSPVAGKKKYHLFIVKLKEYQISLFFFFNSKEGYAADIEIATEDAPCLPSSPTGNSVISCNMFLRYKEEDLSLYKAKKIGVLREEKVREVIAFASVSPALSEKDQVILKNVLEDLANSNPN